MGMSGISSLVLTILSLRFLLKTQVEMSNEQVEDTQFSYSV